MNKTITGKRYLSTGNLQSTVIFILLLTALEANGQTRLIGVTGGINWTNITPVNFPKGNDFRTSITTGLTYEYWLERNISVGANLLYSQRGFSLTLPDNPGSSSNSALSKAIQVTYQRQRNTAVEES